MNEVGQILFLKHQPACKKQEDVFCEAREEGAWKLSIAISTMQYEGEETEIGTIPNHFLAPLEWVPIHQFWI
jgi:hypothetical protein